MKKSGSTANRTNREAVLPFCVMGSVRKSIFCPLYQRKNLRMGKQRTPHEKAATGDFRAYFQPLSLQFLERLERWWGQAISSARKLCLQSWAQPWQTLLYFRLPVPSRKKDHSSRHFLLRLIDRHAPGPPGRGVLFPGACAPNIPVSRPPAAPGWRAFSQARSLRRPPRPSPLPHPGGRY